MSLDLPRIHRRGHPTRHLSLITCNHYYLSRPWSCTYRLQMKHLLAAASIMSLATMAVACATEPSAPAVCDEVAAKLDGCSPAQADALLASCRAQPSNASFAEISTEEIQAACSPSDDGKADAQATLTGVCVASMYGIKWTVGLLSPSVQPLSADVKRQLRPTFGALVDTARLTHAAELPPGITIGGHELSVTPAAMTFGNNIFIAKSWSASISAKELMLTIVHEMQHVQQVTKAGGFFRFATEYCREMIAVNFDYFAIPLEINADGVEQTARANLASGCETVFCR